jgi:hypothetical protein
VHQQCVLQDNDIVPRATEGSDHAKSPEQTIKGMLTIQAQANGLSKTLNIVGTLSLSSTRRCGV